MKKLRFVSSENKAQSSLLTNCGYFIDCLGQPVRDNFSLDFPQGSHSFSTFRVSYIEEKKFLGKIYAMVVDAELSRQGESFQEHNVELHYSGFVMKGLPLFKPSIKRGVKLEQSVELATRLNKNGLLLECCRHLDLEFLRVFWDQLDESWRIMVRPYGGSMVHLLLPPLSYNVALPEGHAESILEVVSIITTILEKYS